jgi:hypothetical protein
VAARNRRSAIPYSAMYAGCRARAQDYLLLTSDVGKPEVGPKPFLCDAGLRRLAQTAVPLDFESGPKVCRDDLEPGARHKTKLAINTPSKPGHS